MPIQEKCRVLDHQQLGPRYFKLTLLSPYISSHGQPGQFVQVRVANGYDPLLRRPISLHRISQEHKTFELLYEVIGQGTEILSKITVGSELDVLGPLGRGFAIDQGKAVHILVGGGMGVAPLLALASFVASRESPVALYVLIGGKTKAYVIGEKEFRAVTDQVLVSTDDGSYGKKGLISDLLLDFLDNQLTTNNLQLTTIYCCGPKAMLKAVGELAWQKKIDCQVSMEERMACGIGTCLGCVIKTKNGYKKVCDEGPVFNSQEVIWDYGA